MLATLASLFVIQGVAMTYSYGGSITENMVLPSGDMAEGTIPAAFSLLGQVPTIVIIMLVVTVLAQLALSLTTTTPDVRHRRQPGSGAPLRHSHHALQSGGLRDCLAAGRAGRHFAGLASARRR
jgi:hypothetical protein